jgi:hypothetical protein
MSLNHNREFGVFFSNPQRVAALSKFMKQDFENPASQTWRDSMACHHVGFASASATTSDGPVKEDASAVDASGAHDNDAHDGDADGDGQGDDGQP